MSTIQQAKLTLNSLWQFGGIFWIGLVLYLSLTSHPPMPEVDIKYFDKIGHFVAYFWLVSWYVNLFYPEKARLIILACFSIMGIAMEYLQSLNPQRSFEYMDMVANVSGAVIAYTIVRGPLARVIRKIDSGISKVR